MSELLDWLEHTSWADAIRQSLWLYPALEIFHILGLVILVGAAFLFDLRLLGVSSNLPISGIQQFLLPWSRRGLILIIPSGLLLFITNASALGMDPTFWTKLTLLTLAGFNALLFHQFASSERIGSEPAFRFKMHALISITLWIGVIACGRMLAY